MILTTKRIVLISVFAVSICLCLAIGFLVGAVAAEGRLYHARFEHESRIIRERVLSDKRFESLKVYEQSRGYATLGGVVASKEDRDELAKRLIQSFGDSLLDDRLFLINIAKLALEQDRRSGE